MTPSSSFKSPTKRGLLQSGALLAAGAIAGCTTSGNAGNAASAPATPFAVADTTIPIAGSTEMFPVRRIYCIGRNIPIDKALELVYGYALGLDMTRRDLQRGMGDQKKPWEIGKSFDLSAPIGPIHKVAQTGHYTKGAIWLKVNGQIKQQATLNHMIWSVAEQISKLSEAFELFPGDIIYSGTPENVGPVVKGDVIECHIDGLPELSVKIV